jgi:hypothetical protein
VCTGCDKVQGSPYNSTPPKERDLQWHGKGGCALLVKVLISMLMLLSTGGRARLITPETRSVVVVAVSVQAIISRFCYRRPCYLWSVVLLISLPTLLQSHSLFAISPVGEAAPDLMCVTFMDWSADEVEEKLSSCLEILC